MKPNRKDLLHLAAIPKAGFTAGVGNFTLASLSMAKSGAASGASRQEPSPCNHNEHLLSI